MKYLFVVLLVLLTKVADAQTTTVMDFVQVTPGMEKEALFYYENNWKIYREAAIKKGIITGYRIEKTKSDSAAAFNLVLITEYKDKLAFEKSEENFRDILSTLRPRGPVLLNSTKPPEFRKNIFVKVTERVAGHQEINQN